MNEDERLNAKVLFKYRNDSELTEDIIKNQKIWLSTPSRLNDPFECRIGEIPRDWEAKTIQKMERGQLLGVIGGLLPFESPKKLFSLSERETTQWLKRFKKLTHCKRVEAMRTLYSDHGIELSKPENVFEDMRKRISSVGVFSLSETASSELMWAHYGANHQGIAFGFSRSDDCKLTNARHCIPVTYSSKKPTFNSGFKNEVKISISSSIQTVSF